MRVEKAHTLYARYTVLRMLSEGKNSLQIASFLRVNSSNVRRRIYLLERDGFIVRGMRSSQQFYELTEKGKNYVIPLRMVFETAHSIDDYRLSLRRHQLIFRYRAVRDFSNRLKDLQAIGFEQKLRGFMDGFEYRRKGSALFFNGKSLLVYPQPVYAATVQEGLLKGLEIAEEARAWVQANTGIELESVMQVRRQQWAMEGGLSRFIPQGYKNLDSQYLIVDGSKGVPELETIDAKLSSEHMLMLMLFLERVIRGKE